VFFHENNNDIVDYDRKTPYTIEKLKTIEGIKYKIIYTIRKGVADSRIINYEMIKIGENIEG
jgi:hypothetical protein